VTVIRPATRWITSCVVKVQRDGPAEHSQIPAEASPSSQRLTPAVLIGPPVASSSGPQSSSSAVVAPERYGVKLVASVMVRRYLN
jgi:hypothetical protein